jgi:hypothetical protein
MHAKVSNHSRPRRRRGLRIPSLTLLFAGLLFAGCETQRTLHITSEPSGALVHVNDEEVGRTPVTVPFKFYGTYGVRLQRDGYDTLATTAEADAPWWEYPGPDLLAAVVPDTKNQVAWHFVLEPSVPVADQDADALIDRAQQLRARTRRGE